MYLAANSRVSILNGDWANRGTNGANKAVAGTNNIVVGSRDDAGGSAWAGRIAHFAIWHAELDEQDIDRLVRWRLCPLLVRPRDLIYYRSLAFDDINFNHSYETYKNHELLDIQLVPDWTAGTLSLADGIPNIIYPRPRFVERVLLGANVSAPGGTILPQMLEHGLYAGNAA
jgi:hypothetical protein